jgi:hypothetical protein
MKILGIIMFFVAFITAIGIFKPSLLNKGAKKPLPRVFWASSSVIYIVFGLLFVFNAENEQKTEPVENATVAPASSALPEKVEDEPLPADPRESEKIKAYGNRLSDIVTRINKEAEKQFKNPDLLAWSSFAQDIRDEIRSEREKFEKEFPVGLVSGGNVQNVLVMSKLYVSVDVDYITSIWYFLDGSRTFDAVEESQNQVISLFKKIQFQQ